MQCDIGHRDPKNTVHYTRSPPDRDFGVESGRFDTEGDQTFTVLERWAFLTQKRIAEPGGKGGGGELMHYSIVMGNQVAVPLGVSVQVGSLVRVKKSAWHVDPFGKYHFDLERMRQTEGGPEQGIA